MRLFVMAMLAALVAACDSKPQPTVDLTRGGKKAMERAQDVSKTIEAGAQRNREAEEAATGAAQSK